MLARMCAQPLLCAVLIALASDRQRGAASDYFQYAPWARSRLRACMRACMQAGNDIARPCPVRACAQPGCMRASRGRLATAAAPTVAAAVRAEVVRGGKGALDCAPPVAGGCALRRG